MKTYTRILMIMALIVTVTESFSQSGIAEEYRQMIEKVRSEFDDMMTSMRESVRNPMTAGTSNSEISIAEVKEIAAEESVETELGFFDEIPIGWPSDDYSEISSPYGYRNDPFTRKRAFHHGIDIPMPENTPVLSTAAGTVEKTGTNKVSGRYIVIKHKNHKTIFAHLNRVIVKEGSSVKPGDSIGYSGNTGRSTGPHLHYQISTRKGTTINPINFIKQHQNF